MGTVDSSRLHYKLEVEPEEEHVLSHVLGSDHSENYFHKKLNLFPTAPLIFIDMYLYRDMGGTCGSGMMFCTVLNTS